MTSSTLPTYPQFLRTLPRVPILSLPPTESCLICHQPFARIISQLPTGTDLSTLSLFTQLPFSLPYAPDIDYPVRLPCAHAHISGLSCLKAWFDLGKTNTCLLCMEPLFQPPTRESHRQRTIARKRRLAEEKERVGSLPLRKLIMDHKEWTFEQRIRVKTQSFRSEIICYMILMAMRLQRPMIREPPGFVKLYFCVKDYNDPLDLIYPVDDLDNFLSAEDRESGTGTGTNEIQTSPYRQAILSICNATSLIPETGKYPEWINMLLSEQAEGMYNILIDHVESNVLDSSWIAIECAGFLIWGVEVHWERMLGEKYGEKEGMGLLLRNTVYAWVARGTMITEVEDRWGVDDEDEDEEEDEDEDEDDNMEDGSEDGDSDHGMDDDVDYDEEVRISGLEWDAFDGIGVRHV